MKKKRFKCQDFFNQPLDKPDEDHPDHSFIVPSFTYFAESSLRGIFLITRNEVYP